MVVIGLTVLDASVSSHRLQSDEASAQLQVARSYVQVPCGACARPATIIEAIRQQLGFDSVLLKRVGNDFAEVEYIAPAGKSPSTLTWRRRKEVEHYSKRPLWQRPGWYGEVLPEVDAELARHGMKRIGLPNQVRHTSITGLFRIPTQSGPVWLKLVLPMFAHEPAVVRWVSSATSVEVPTVLGSGTTWWVAADFPGTHHMPDDDVLRTIADVHIASISRTDELRALGCPEYQLDRLVDDVAQLVRRTELIPGEDRVLLRRSLPALRRMCGGLARGFPATLVHGDLYPGNTRWTEKGWFIFDWTDSCITHPFIELARPLTRISAATRQRRLVAYSTRWSGLISRNCLRRAMRSAEAIGAAHQAMNYGAILEALPNDCDMSTEAELRRWLHHWVRALDCAIRANREDTR